MGIVLEENDSDATFPNDRIKFKKGFASIMEPVDNAGKGFINNSMKFGSPDITIKTPKPKKLSMPKGTDFMFGGFDSDVIQTGSKRLSKSKLPKAKREKLPKIKRQKLPKFRADPDVIRMGSDILGRTSRRRG